MWTMVTRGQHSLRVGLLYLIGTGLAYALCIVILAAGGDRPGDLTPWLRISTDTYFWWEAVFITPVIVGSGLLAASCMYLFARAARGTGRFDDGTREAGKFTSFFPFGLTSS